MQVIRSNVEYMKGISSLWMNMQGSESFKWPI
jgi:hypothetical protein